MAPRGRPPDTREKFVVRLTLILNRGEDDDLIELYERTPAGYRAKVTVMAMRAGGVEVVTDQIEEGEEELVEAVSNFVF